MLYLYICRCNLCAPPHGWISPLSVGLDLRSNKQASYPSPSAAPEYSLSDLESETGYIVMMQLVIGQNN